jgi:tRNA threonylcarbamoyl adenosine modification protein YeaZ
MDATVQKILAVETSGKTLSAALAESGDSFTVRSEIHFEAGFRHAELLKNSCAFLLDQCGWKKEDLSMIAVSTGPGSFTGLRVGIAFARALAQGLDLPLVGIDSFEVLAKGAQNPYPLWILIDSIGDEIFEGVFKPGNVHPQRAYRVSKIADTIRRLPRFGKVSVIGNGADHHQELILKKLKKRLAPIPTHAVAPRASVLAALAAEKFKRSKPADLHYEKTVPFYLRPPLVVERFKGEKQ